MTPFTTNPTLQIHPELSSPQRQRGVFELTGLPGGLRVFLAYDDNGHVRHFEGMLDRDVGENTLSRIEARLDELLARDQEMQA